MEKSTHLEKRKNLLKAKQEIVKRWERSGYLDGLHPHADETHYKLFECEKKKKIGDAEIF